MKFCKIWTEYHISFLNCSWMSANFRSTPAFTVLIRYVSVHRQNSPYFVKSSPRCSSLRALIYPRLRANSRLYEKLCSGSAFLCYARREDEEGDCSEDGVEGGRGILLYQTSTDFTNSYFRDDYGKRNVRRDGSSPKIIGEDWYLW